VVISSNKTLVVISSNTTLVNFDWIDRNRSLNKSRIVKIEKYPNPDPDSKILEQERSRSLKK